MICLRMDDWDGNTSEQPERDQALLFLGKPIILEREGESLKDCSRIHEIEAVLLQVEGALAH